MRAVIVGYGMAGARLASELLARDRTLDLTVLGAEPHPAYNRILLSNLLAGRADERSALLPAPRGERLRLLPGVAAVAVDRLARTVSGADGVTYPYDALVLATGADPVVPRIAGLRDPLLFRTLDDCRRILASAVGARTAIVLGGGLLGLEAARGLAGRGLAVTVVHAADRLMNRQLDAGASAVLRRTLARLDIAVRLDSSVVAAVGGSRGLRFADGTEVRADLLVVSCGVRPSTGLAARAGLAVGRGILVDDELRTSDPDILAIGDCVEYPGSPAGLVAPAWAQASVVADLLTGADPGARYRPVPPVTRLKAAGIDLAAMGPSAVEPDEAVVFSDPARGRYAKLVIRDGRLASAIMLGDQPSIGAVIQHFDRQTPLPDDPRALLLARPGAGPAAGAGRVGTGGDEGGTASPALMPDATVICRCNAVTKGAITRAWLGGARDIAAATRAGTGCGGCVDVVDSLTTWLSSVDQQAARATADPVAGAASGAASGAAPIAGADCDVSVDDVQIPEVAR